MKVSIDGGLIWQDMDEVQIEHEVLTAQGPSYLNSTFTKEGLIQDVYHIGGTHAGTYGETAQEIGTDKTSRGRKDENDGRLQDDRRRDCNAGFRESLQCDVSRD